MLARVLRLPVRIGTRTQLRALSAAGTTARPFWRTKTLSEMTSAEWESLCDGCGRCCAHQLEDIETGVVGLTDVACRLLDVDTCRCTSYDTRHSVVPECVDLSPHAVEELSWMPPSCGYRKIANGKKLAWWHPLRSGDPETVVAAGISVRGKLISEEGFEGDLEDRIVAFKKPGKSARDGEGEEEEEVEVVVEEEEDEESREEDGGIRLDASVVAELGVRLDVEDGAGGLSALQDLDDAALLRLVGGEEGACEALKAQLAAISEPGAA